jgi:CO dehydrogenase maturation factor
LIDMKKSKTRTPVIAVCGKGGVGKTVLACLLARALLERRVRPLLLVDADPAGGLLMAMGETHVRTLADVRGRLVSGARRAGGDERQRLARELDYMVMEALLERPDFSMLAMGRSRDRGCYCPANALLREAIDVLAHGFAAVIIDAEAGLEQIHRKVTRGVSRVLVLSDGSKRSMTVADQIADMAGRSLTAGVYNRAGRRGLEPFPAGMPCLGAIPEDRTLRRFDRLGRPLWELPDRNPALEAVRMIGRKLGLSGGKRNGGRP